MILAIWKEGEKSGNGEMKRWISMGVVFIVMLM